MLGHSCSHRPLRDLRNSSELGKSNLRPERIWLTKEVGRRENYWFDYGKDEALLTGNSECSRHDDIFPISWDPVVERGITGQRERQWH